MTSRRNSQAFWLGFLIAIIVVVSLSIYFYQGNKDKKLKDIKSNLEKFLKSKLKCSPKPVTKRPVPKVSKIKSPPKKFISKK